MKVIRLGSRGEEVKQWELFLKGRYPKSDIVVEGVFDHKTHELTVQFQKDNRLTSDGIVGLGTYGAAMKLGFNPGIIDDRTDEGPNWPPRPSDFKQLTPQEREALFGRFSYVSAPTSSNPEAIKITDNWANENIVSVQIPQLIGVKGASASGNVQFHKKSAHQLVMLFQAWESAGLKDRILSFGGTWVPRFIRGSRTSLSNHSWGNAIDINVEWNGLGVTPVLKGQKGSVRELVMIAHQCGFAWLGWANRPDGMHFEICRLV